MVKTKKPELDFSEQNLRKYAAKALAGRTETTLISHIHQSYIDKANEMPFTEMASLVAKTFFKRR